MPIKKISKYAIFFRSLACLLSLARKFWHGGTRLQSGANTFCPVCYDHALALTFHNHFFFYPRLLCSLKTLKKSSLLVLVLPAYLWSVVTSFSIGGEVSSLDHQSIISRQFCTSKFIFGRSHFLIPSCHAVSFDSRFLMTL